MWVWISPHLWLPFHVEAIILPILLGSFSKADHRWAALADIESWFGRRVTRRYAWHVHCNLVIGAGALSHLPCWKTIVLLLLRDFDRCI